MAERIEHGIMTYLWTYPQAERSLQRIENLCEYLCGPHDLDFRKKARQAVRSLLVQGLIEFKPANKIRLSPSNALSLKNRLLLTNPPYDCTLTFCELAIKSHGVDKRVILRNEETLECLRKSGMPIANFSFESLLKRAVSLESVVTAWDKAKVIHTGSFQFRTNQGWIAPDNVAPDGVYRVSPHPYSQCYLKYGGAWLTIPRREQNIDGYPIAVFLCELEATRSRKLLIYDSEKHILTIKTWYFPLIIERLLFINTALVENANADILSRTYAVPPSAVKHMNRILNKTITTA